MIVIFSAKNESISATFLNISVHIFRDNTFPVKIIQTESGRMISHLKLVASQNSDSLCKKVGHTGYKGSHLLHFIHEVSQECISRCDVYINLISRIQDLSQRRGGGSEFFARSMNARVLFILVLQTVYTSSEGA